MRKRFIYRCSLVLVALMLGVCLGACDKKDGKVVFTTSLAKDELFHPYIRRLLTDDTPSMYSPETGWLLGEGDYGFQAYNVKTDKMVNITSWAEQPNGSYFCYW